MKKKAPLSKRENKVWEYILEYFMDHDWGPTHKEIAEGCDFKTAREATDCLHNMRDKGWIKLSKNKWRNIINPKDYEKRKKKRI